MCRIATTSSRFCLRAASSESITLQLAETLTRVNLSEHRAVWLQFSWSVAFCCDLLQAEWSANFAGPIADLPVWSFPPVLPPVHFLYRGLCKQRVVRRQILFHPSYLRHSSALAPTPTSFCSWTLSGCLGLHPRGNRTVASAICDAPPSES